MLASWDSSVTPWSRSFAVCRTSAPTIAHAIALLSPAEALAVPPPSVAAPWPPGAFRIRSCLPPFEVELVQEAMNHWSEQQPGDADDREAAVKRVKRGE